jgi:hypothetical protein
MKYTQLLLSKQFKRVSVLHIAGKCCSTWFQAEEKSSPQAIATSSDRARLSSPSMMTTDKPEADN